MRVSMTHSISPRKFTPRDAFAGFHDDTVASVVMLVCSELDENEAVVSEESWHGEVLGKARCLLLQCAFPEAVARLFNTQIASQAAEIWTEYFGVQQHSSLAAYIRDILFNKHPTFSRRKYEGFLVQVTTHSRLSSDKDLVDIVGAIHFPLANVCQVNLKQFHTEQQFCYWVRDFFAKLGGNEGLLFVQSECGDSNAKLIACARHLLSEQRLASNKYQQGVLDSHTVYPVHMVLVIQLLRIPGEYTKFVGFQGGRWLSIYIDELRPPTRQIPSIEFLADIPISTLFDVAPHENSMEEVEEVEEVGIIASVQDKVDIVGLLRTCVQAAVGRIDDTSPADSRATRRIDLMLNLLPEKVSQHTDVCFATLLARRIHELMQQRDERTGTDRAAGWLRAEARCSTGVHESGTFRKALWQRIYSAVIPILAEVIAFIDRDANLELVKTDGSWLSRVWLCFLQSPQLTCLRYGDFLSPVKGTIRDRVPLLTSGQDNHVYEGNFPFSVLVKQDR